MGDIGRNLVGKQRGPRARPVGIAKGKAGHEVAGTHHVQGILKILFAFTGKAHDKVCGKGQVGPRRTQALHKVKKARAVVAAFHAGQHCVRTGLHGQVQTRAELGQFRKGGNVFRPHILGVRGNIAQTFKPRQAGHLAQQGGKACAVAAFVLPKGVDVLPKQGDFARAVVDQCLAFVNDCRAAARLLTATGKGHNAVRAKVVATLHNVGIGHGPIDNAGFGCGLALHILAGEIEQREALRRIFEQAFDGLRGIADAIAARHKAYLAFFFKNAFAKLLGHAAGHAHQY